MKMTHFAMASIFWALMLIYASVHVEAGRTFQVWVGYQDRNLGLDVNRFIPDTLRIHPGDTVVFQQKTHDRHTVTFYRPPNGTLPPLLLNGFEANPLVLERTTFSEPYDGSFHANSGIMELGETTLGTPMPTSWRVPFGDTLGEFAYACSIHGLGMSGKIIVVPRNVKVPTPKQINKRIQQRKKGLDKRKRQVYNRGAKSVRATVANGDGTRTHYVRIGYAEGEVQFRAFFKKNTVVNPGDRIVWYGSNFHTVTFLNGNPPPPFLIEDQGRLVFNPLISAPSNGPFLDRSVLISSGVLVDPSIEYGLTVPENFPPGKIQYFCIPHVGTIMRGTVEIVAKRTG